MNPRTFRVVAGTLLFLGVAFIALVAVLHFVVGDSSDSAIDATTMIATTSTTVPPPTTTMATTTTRRVERRDLLDALQAGIVEAEFRSTGGASGDIVKLAIRLLAATDDVVTLSVPAGMMLTNPAGGEQDLVIRGLVGVMTGEFTYQEVTEIELPDVEWRDYVVEAYCAEAHDDNPTADGVLTASGLAGEDLIGVFAALGEAGDDIDLQVIQAVIWAVTDDIRTDQLDDIGYGLDEAGVAQARDIIERAGLDPGEFRLFR